MRINITSLCSKRWNLQTKGGTVCIVSCITSETPHNIVESLHLHTAIRTTIFCALGGWAYYTPSPSLFVSSLSVSISSYVPQTCLLAHAVRTVCVSQATNGLHDLCYVKVVQKLYCTEATEYVLYNDLPPSMQWLLIITSSLWIYCMSVCSFNCIRIR